MSELGLCHPLRYPKSGFSPSCFPESCQSPGQAGEAAGSLRSLLLRTGKHLSPHTLAASLTQLINTSPEFGGRPGCFHCWKMSLCLVCSECVRKKNPWQSGCPTAPLGYVGLRGPQLGGLCIHLAQPRARLVDRAQIPRDTTANQTWFRRWVQRGTLTDLQLLFFCCQQPKVTHRV